MYKEKNKVEDKSIEKKVVIELFMNEAMAKDLLESLDYLVGAEANIVDWTEHGYDDEVYPYGFYEDEITTAIKDVFLDID